MATKYNFNITDSVIYELSCDIYNLYQMKSIVNYIHNGKTIPFKYEKLIERPISSLYSNIDRHITIQRLLTNTLRYCFTNSTSKNTQEIKQLRETIMRIKLNINQIKEKNPINESEIITKENEIILLNQKIDEINNTIDNNNSIKNKYVNVVESAYNIFLRKDSFPKYLYIEVCKRLGVKINFDEHFIRDNENERISVVNGIVKKEYTCDTAKEDAMIYNRSRNKPSRYVPPCFRQNNEFIEESIEEVLKIDEENKEIKEESESFPILNNKPSNTSNNNLNIWNNKPKIICDNIIPEIKNTKQENIISTVNIVTLDNKIDNKIDNDDWSAY